MITLIDDTPEILTFDNNDTTMLTKTPTLKVKIPKVKTNTILEILPCYAKAIFIVMNDKGLHTRPSAELVKCVTNFKAEINLIHHDLVVNAKSLLGILTLAATRGSRIAVEARGEDAEIAVQTILELAKNKFYIHY